MPGRLSQKVCVVTGTGGSLGRATTHTFAREGGSVVGCDVAVEPAEETVAIAAAPVIEKYTGVLAAADVFTESTTFQVLQSIRLDLGYGSWVHP